jgi:plasmid stability protein
MSIRNLGERVLELLRIRAARHGRSMEAEVRAILVDAVREPDEGPNLGQAATDLDRMPGHAASAAGGPGRASCGKA